MSVQRPMSGWLSPLVAAMAILHSLPVAVTVAQSGARLDSSNPSSRQIKEVLFKAQALLEGLLPRPSPDGALYASQSDQPVEKLENAGGMIQWGHLFLPEEIVALVNLAPPPDSDDVYHIGPQYLCVFAWEGNRWVHRQFLDNVYDLSVHHRADEPRAFLQGSYRTGRYDGEHLSWFFDPKSKQLVRTNFEDWGPFYLAGWYLVTTDGFKRLAHDWSHTVYSYENGKQGRWLACVHETDREAFIIEYVDTKSNQSQRWGFKDRADGEGPTVVKLQHNAKEDDPPWADDGEEVPQAGTAKITVKKDKNFPTPADYFGFLTGLNPALLEDKWMDELPKWTPPKSLPVEVTGDHEIVTRFR